MSKQTSRRSLLTGSIGTATLGAVTAAGNVGAGHGPRKVGPYPRTLKTTEDHAKEGPTMDIETYRTTTPLVPDVSVTDIGAERFYRPCNRIMVDDVEPGDVFMVSSCVQVTQPKYMRVMLGRFLQVAEETGWADGTTIDRPMTTNIDRYIHHYPFRTAGVYHVGNTVPSHLFFQQFMYSVTLSADWVNGDKLVVDYVDLTVTRFRAGQVVADLSSTVSTLQAAAVALDDRLKTVERTLPFLKFDDDKFE